MKYIAYVVLIMVAATVGIFAFNLLNKPSPPTDAALIINGRTVTLPDLQDRYERSPYGREDRDAFYESVIVRELLVQEAQKAGIDREESFRRMVQEFFEQSLIKVFMDRKYQEFSIALTPEEIDAYQKHLNRRFRLTLLHYSSLDEAQQNRNSTAEHLNAAFLDLPVRIRWELLALEPGDKTAPFPIEKEYIVVELEANEPLAPEEQTIFEGTTLKNKIMEEKQRLMMDRWINALRHNAQVSFLISKNAELGRVP